jgi:predicted RNA-binding protein YlxR (DUF448 family)
VPRRRCVGCGRIAPKTELLRIALAVESGRRRAIVDHDGTLPGRGAYLCRAADVDSPTRAAGSCLQHANRRGAIARALRSAVTLDRELVESPDSGKAS